MYLTKTEKIIAVGVGKGYSNLEIARKVNYSEDAVKSEIRKMYIRYGCNRRVCFAVSVITDNFYCRHREGKND